jgi:hypothetical protein
MIMAQGADVSRTQMVHQLNEAGFEPQAIDKILWMIDAMLTGNTALAHVLVASAEVCKACQLSGTHRHIANALGCLAQEVTQSSIPPLDASPVARLAARGMAATDGPSIARIGSGQDWQSQSMETYSKVKGA